MINTTIVVKVAMTRTNIGSRTTSGMNRRKSEIKEAEPISTNALAIANPLAFAMELLTASNGHKPRS